MLKLQKHKPEEKQQVFQVLLVQQKNQVVASHLAVLNLLQTRQIPLAWCVRPSCWRTGGSTG